MKHKLWFAVLVITSGMLGLLAWLKLPLGRNTIIHSESGGTFVTASGKEYPTNRWFNRTGEFQFVQLQSPEGGVIIRYLIEDYDEHKKVRLRIGNSEYDAILDHLDWKSKGDVLNYTVRPGKKVK